MKKTNRIQFLGVGLLVLSPFLLIALFQPVDISKDNCLQVTGIVEALSEAGTKDIVFSLTNNPNHYYINRGLEQGLTFPELKQQLLGKEIELWHAQSWQTSDGHITKVRAGKEIIYSEWGDNF